MKNKTEDTFPQFIEYLLGAEGKHSNDVNDRGGETWYGLSSKFLNGIGWGDAPPTREEAIALYKKYFWQGWRCTEMHPYVAWCACDAYIQHPPTAVIKMLQHGLEVKVDGVMGPATIAASKSPNIPTFWRKYRLARIRYYNNIVENDPTQVDFIDGWQERLHKLAEAMYFAGIIPAQTSRIKEIVTSDNAKVAGIGSVVGVVSAGLVYLGIDPQSAQEWLTSVIPTGSTLGIGMAWLAKTFINKG